MTSAGFGEDIERAERAHHAVQSRGICPRDGCQFKAIHGLPCQMIGDVELGRYIKCLRRAHAVRDMTKRGSSLSRELDRHWIASPKRTVSRHTASKHIERQSAR